ncbi:hypothetical protein ACOJBO_02370 [Rhizobium beringeri]
MLGHIAGGVTTTAMQAKLANDAELIAERDGLAVGQTPTPAADRISQRNIVITGPLLSDEAKESLDLERTASIGMAHGALERQEALRVGLQLGQGHDGHHVGTGNAISRSVSVAMRT